MKLSLFDQRRIQHISQHKLFARVVGSGMCLLLPAVASLGQSAGQLDLDFSANGIQIDDISGSDQADAANALIQMDDGNILAVGYAYPFDSFSDFALVKYTPDGTVESVVLDEFLPGLNILSARAVSKDSVNGRDVYYVAGDREIGGGHPVTVARYLNDLTRDSTWANNGMASVFIDGQFDACSANEVVVQSDGKVLVAGSWEGKLFLVRFSTDGTLDPNFSFDGKVTTDLPGSGEGIHAMAITPNGKILVAGRSQTSSPIWSGFIARYNSDGSLDQSFATGGYRFVSWNASLSCYITSLSILSDGHIIVAGQADATSSNSDFAIAKLTPDGSTFDTAFGTAGKVLIDYAQSSEFVMDMAIDQYGKIILLGYGELELARLNENGTMDNNFGTNGLVVSTLPSSTVGSCQPKSVIIDDMNRIVMAGTFTSVFPPATNFFIARYRGLNLGLLEFGLAPHSLNVYPNPISGPFNVMFTLSCSEPLTIALLDPQGRLLATYMDGKDLPPGEHSQTITMPEDLAPGNYMLVLSSPKGRMSVQVSKQ